MYIQKILQYSECFRKYFQVCEYSELYKNIWRQLSIDFSGKKILSVGAGTCDVEIDLAKNWQTSVRIIEPNEVYVEGAKFNWNLKKSPKGKIDFYPCSTFEEYNDNKTYNIIFFNHSWYAFDRNQDVVKKALSLLERNGKIFIILNKKYSLQHQIAQIGKTFEASPSLTCESVFDWILNLLDEGTSVCKIYYHSHQMQNSLLSEQRITNNGKLVADFLTFGRFINSRDEIKLIQLIQTHSAGDFIFMDYGIIEISRA